MKSFFNVILLLLIPLSCPCAEQSLRKNGDTNLASVTIKFPLEASEVKANHPVNVFVLVTNISKSATLIFGQPPDDPGFSLNVISPSGKTLPVATNWTSLSPNVFWVHPKQAGQYGLNLSHICNFDELGTYQVQVTMKIAVTNAPEKFTIAVSNPLEVKIIP